MSGRYDTSILDYGVYQGQLYLGCSTGDQIINPGNNVSKYWWIKAKEYNLKQDFTLNGQTNSRQPKQVNKAQMEEFLGKSLGSMWTHRMSSEMNRQC